MNTNLVYLRPLKLAYVRATGPYAASSAKAWAELFAWLENNGLHSFPGCGYGLMLDDHLTTDPQACRYEACVEMKGALEHRAEGHLQIRKLPAGAYFRQRHIGSYDDLREKALTVRSGWAEENNLELDARRPVVQIYLDDPRSNDHSQLRGDLCVPIVAQAPA
jgi:AraC family transcriptional regulator